MQLTVANKSLLAISGHKTIHAAKKICKLKTAKEFYWLAAAHVKAIRACLHEMPSAVLKPISLPQAEAVDAVAEVLETVLADVFCQSEVAEVLETVIADVICEAAVASALTAVVADVVDSTVEKVVAEDVHTCSKCSVLLGRDHVGVICGIKEEETYYCYPCYYAEEDAKQVIADDQRVIDEGYVQIAYGRWVKRKKPRTKKTAVAI